MELFYAHYPSLEESFINFVRTRRENPLEKWLVVCASSLLAKRLGGVLAREYGAVANIHFVVGSSLVGTLDAESGGGLPLFPQDHLRDFLLKEIVSEPGLDRYPVSDGFITALKASLRDLADSMVSPEVLEEYLQGATDPVLEQDGERFAWLIKVYQRFLEREAQIPGYRPYRAMFEKALSQVEESAYLQGFSKIIFYGFYDMPGRQLELLGRIRSCYSVTVFAPYKEHPAYRFARKFFETNWLGRARQKHNVEKSVPCALGQSAEFLFSSEGSAPAPHVQWVSAGDERGEIFFAVKEILRLVEEEGYSFSDIALVTRSTVPYQDEVRRVFTQNGIALNAAFSYPLQKFPIGVFCLNLFSLALHGFEKETVLSVLSSPYFNQPQKQKWRMQAVSSLVSRDFNQWKDLLPQVKDYDPAFLAWLEACKNQLEELAQPRPWQEGCMLAKAFLQRYVAENLLRGKELEIYQAVLEKIDSLAQYASIRSSCYPGELVRELTGALSALSFNEAENIRGGVVFTDAVRARGLQFKVIFLMGLNEKSFPPAVPEDPILQDHYRYLMRDLLGYWINQKSERFDEERLLFFSVITAASKRLYVSWGRASSDGKAAVPSVYLAELARASAVSLEGTELSHISGRLSEQLAAISSKYLTPKELSYFLVMRHLASETVYQEAGLLNEGVMASLEAARLLQRHGGLTAYDGKIESGGEIFEDVNNSKGFSPSALQELASCPMKYFFDKGLGLGDWEEPCSRQELSPDKRGSAYHKVLEHFYGELARSEMTKEIFSSAAREYLEHSLSQFYTAESYKWFGIYPVVWELILEDIRTKLVKFVTADLAQLGPYTPVYFEKEFAGLKAEGFVPRLRGIIDRIDIDPASKTFIVADYKSSRKGTKNLASDFFTHLIFQPFLYVLAAQQLPELKDFRPAGACLLSINKGYNRRELSQTEWEEMRPRVEKFLTLLSELVEKGEFFLSPSQLCDYCPYTAICRRDAFKSLLRARKSSCQQKLEEARQ